MQRSSETIGTIAAALAKAQAQLVNPEKSLVGTIRSDQTSGAERSFRYAPLSSGLDIVRALCSQQGGGLINLPYRTGGPTDGAQQNAFEDLRKARLDTAETRLKAMADAIDSIRPPLENFYASLNDEQKARFNMMGPALRAASSQSIWSGAR